MLILVVIVVPQYQDITFALQDHIIQLRQFYDVRPPSLSIFVQLSMLVLVTSTSILMRNVTLFVLALDGKFLISICQDRRLESYPCPSILVNLFFFVTYPAQ